MKRMHIHVGVDDVDESVKFYSALFGAQPVKVKADYAKWMLDEPAVNFAVSTHTATRGVDHLGVQVDSEDELQQMRDRLKGADLALLDEGETVCCYARSDKSWIKDPTGIAWEAYMTMADVQVSNCQMPKATQAAEAATSDASGSAEEPARCCGPA